MNEIIKEIYDSFEENAKAYCAESGGIRCDLVKYDDESKIERIESAFIHYDYYSVEFKYTPHGTLSLVNGILECLVHINDVALPAPDLQFYTDFFNLNITSPMTIPYICDRNSMSQAFSYFSELLAYLTKYIDKFENDPDLKEQFRKYYSDEIKYILNITDESGLNADDETSPADLFLYDRVSKFITDRFTSDAYLVLLKGNKLASLKKFKRIKRPLSYEKRMINILESDTDIFIPEVSSTREYAEIINNRGAVKTDFKELKALIISWLVLGPAFSVPYAAIYFIFYSISKKGSLFYIGTLWNIFSCLCLGMLTGICMSYFTRYKFYKLVNKKSYEKYIRLSSITNGKKSDKLMKVFTTVFVAVLIAVCMLLSRMGVKFTNEGMIDNSEFLRLSGELYTYDKIEKVYFKTEREDSENSDVPSYVIVTKDGKEIDLYHIDYYENYESDFIKFLDQKGIEIKK